MLLKVCGMANEENITQVAALRPDYMGFILYERSPRFIQPSLAAIIGNLNIKKVGVVVNAGVEELKKYQQQYGFDLWQLHGDESPDFVEKVKNIFPKMQVIKAFGVAEHFNNHIIKEYEDIADYFLLDTKTSAYGGSGKLFDWTVLQDLQTTKPLFLSGGIGVEELKMLSNYPSILEKIYAIDMNSRLEDAPGMKNIEKLRQARDLINKMNEIAKIGKTTTDNK